MSDGITSVRGSPTGYLAAEPAVTSTSTVPTDAVAVIYHPARTRVLAVSYKEHLVGRVEVRPYDTTYLLLAHCGCNRKPNDPTQRNLLSYVTFKGSYRSVELILRRPPVSF